MGKTLWGRSLGTHLYFNGLYSGAEAIKADSAEYAVFDDIAGGFKFFHAFKQWLGCQMQFQVKILYKDPQLIAWGKPCIWLSNTDPAAELSSGDYEWLCGNCTIVYLDTPIVHANKTH